MQSYYTNFICKIIVVNQEFFVTDINVTAMVLATNLFVVPNYVMYDTYNKNITSNYVHCTKMLVCSFAFYDIYSNRLHLSFMYLAYLYDIRWIIIFQVYQPSLYCHEWQSLDHLLYAWVDIILLASLLVAAIYFQWTGCGIISFAMKLYEYHELHWRKYASIVQS